MSACHVFTLLAFEWTGNHFSVRYVQIHKKQAINLPLVAIYWKDISTKRHLGYFSLPRMGR